jgi:hypothetical protein
VRLKKEEVMMKDFKSMMRCLRRNGKVMLRGMLKALYGAGTAFLFAIAVYGFLQIPNEGGYVAVCDFVAAVGSVCIALWCMYDLGRVKGAKR